MVLERVNVSVFTFIDNMVVFRRRKEYLSVYAEELKKRGMCKLIILDI